MAPPSCSMRVSVPPIVRGKSVKLTKAAGLTSGAGVPHRPERPHVGDLTRGGPSGHLGNGYRGRRERCPGSSSNVAPTSCDMGIWGVPIFGLKGPVRASEALTL
jgi:hypothetical protein